MSELKKQLTSVLIAYNNKDAGTWLKTSSKTGKEFYSISIPSKQKNLRVNFVVAPKYVYRDTKKNEKTGDLGNQQIYLFKEWNYQLNIYNVDTKKAETKDLTGEALTKHFLDRVENSKKLSISTKKSTKIEEI